MRARLVAGVVVLLGLLAPVATAAPTVEEITFRPSATAQELVVRGGSVELFTGGFRDRAAGERPGWLVVQRVGDPKAPVLGITSDPDAIDGITILHAVGEVLPELSPGVYEVTTSEGFLPTTLGIATSKGASAVVRPTTRRKQTELVLTQGTAPVWRDPVVSQPGDFVQVSVQTMGTDPLLHLQGFCLADTVCRQDATGVYDSTARYDSYRTWFLWQPGSLPAGDHAFVGTAAATAPDQRVRHEVIVVRRTRR